MEFRFLYSFLLIGLLVLSGCTTGEHTVPVSQIVPDQKGVPTSEATGKAIETLYIDGKYFEKTQFHETGSPDDNCKFQHYHAEAALATSVCGVTMLDPDPESCGFGKVSDVPVKTITESQIRNLCPSK